MATILELSEIVSSRTKTINDYLQAKGIAQPTFDAGQPEDYLPKDDQHIQNVRKELRDAAKKLSDLSAGNQNLFFEKAVGYCDPSAFRVVYDFKIPQNVPHDGSISYEDLSAKVGLEVTILRRIVRYAALMRVFREPSPNQVVHTALSYELGTNPSCMDMLGHYLDEVFPSGVYLSAALQKWKGADLTPKHTGFNLAYDFHDGSFFDYTGIHKDRAVRFGASMAYFSTANAALASEALNGYGWSKGCNKFVDMGGNRGHVSIAILRANPNIAHALVQDLPEVVCQVDGAPDDLKGRLEYQAHSFFEPQTVTDADVYFFRRVLHDWPDAECAKMIKNLVPAMKTGSRLVLNEWVLPTPGTGYQVDEQWMRWADMMMMMILNAKERGPEEWKALIEGASDGQLRFQSAALTTVVAIKL